MHKYNTTQLPILYFYIFFLISRLSQHISLGFVPVQQPFVSELVQSSLGCIYNSNLPTLQKLLFFFAALDKS